VDCPHHTWENPILLVVVADFFPNDPHQNPGHTSSFLDDFVGQTNTDRPPHSASLTFASLRDNQLSF